VKVIDGRAKPGDDEVLGTAPGPSLGVTMKTILCLSMLAFLGFLAASLPSCGGGSDLTMQETCDQAMAAICERANTCGGAPALLAMGGYSSVAECTTGLQTSNCSNPADIACDPGTTFQESQAKKCISDLKNQACTDLDNEPASCTLICAAGGGAGGSGAGGIGVPGNGGAGGSGGGGGLAAQDACKQVMAAVCERTSACFGAEGLAALGYTTVAACTADMQAEACATPADADCDPGLTYHPEQAQKCVDGMVTLTCANYASGTMPAACDLVCQ
jgi:hypothetical protein